MKAKKIQKRNMREKQKRTERKEKCYGKKLGKKKDGERIEDLSREEDIWTRGQR